MSTGMWIPRFHKYTKQCFENNTQKLNILLPPKAFHFAKVHKSICRIQTKCTLLTLNRNNIYIILIFHPLITTKSDKPDAQSIAFNAVDLRLCKSQRRKSIFILRPIHQLVGNNPLKMLIHLVKIEIKECGLEHVCWLFVSMFECVEWLAGWVAWTRGVREY